MVRMRAVLALCLACLAPPAAAQVPGDAVRLDVLPGGQTEGGEQMAGLAFTLAPGWKTYWRAPGDAGIPPQIEIGGENIAATRLHWPVPVVFDQNGMRSIGYHDRVVLPIAVTPARPGEAMRLTGRVEMGVCEEICVPVSLTFDAMLDPAGRRGPAIVAALVNRPLTEGEAGVTRATCTLTPTEKGMAITATLSVPSAGGTEAIAIETADPRVWVSEPAAQRQGGTLTAVAEMRHDAGGGFAVDRSGIRITVLGRNHAVDVRGCDAG